jgi:anti-sigma regulatory factor (Ser/Thr protein kinase)
MASLRLVADLPGDPGAPAAARGLVRAVLRGWRMEALTADAELAVSELMTNAVVHAPGDEPYQLEISQRERGIRLAIVDGSSIPPVIRALEETQPGGRGLVIIAALSSAWGHDERPDGKQVWVDLDGAAEISEHDA